MIDGFKSWNVITNITDDSLNYNGLRFKVNQFGGFVVSGSLHKFSNGGNHNANDYLFTDFLDTLNQLHTELNINPDITQINGFEFGVNIKLPTNPETVLNRLILYKSNSGANNSKSYKEFKFSDYSFKIYDKSALTKIEPYQSGDILRIEVNVNSMKYFKKKESSLHCNLLSDLLDVAVWERLENILINCIGDCLFIELTTKEINQLSAKERERYLSYINPAYWNELHRNRQKYCREKQRCVKFLNKHSNSTLKTDLINLVRVKCKELRNVTESEKLFKMWNKLPVFKINLERSKCNELPIKINKESVTSTHEQLTSCKGCGNVIENPRKGQMYCSAKVVGYNEAHQCRNNNSNPRNNTKKSIRRVLSIPLMFDLSETIAPEKRMYL